MPPCEPTLFVTGLGRCGTTMVMHMLMAAGVPFAGSPPSFEDIPVRPSQVDQAWVDQQAGRAVKWLDPTVTHVRSPNGAAIFLARNPEEQARSQLKLLGKTETRTARRGLARLITRDTRRARRIVTNRFGDHFVLPLTFEAVVSNPHAAAEKIARLCDTLGLPFGDTEAAAGVVINRSPECRPDLSVERDLLARCRVA